MTDLFETMATEGRETRRCGRCKDTPGLYVSRAFTGASGRRYPETSSPCLCCNGQPDMPMPDFRAVVLACKGRKGLRSSRPKEDGAYYVWRWARFYGGADVTLPMMASGDLRGNPWTPEYDAVARLVAARVFGTARAGTHRWNRALGREDRDEPGLPASAYPGGRVADRHKPLEEAAELI